MASALPTASIKAALQAHARYLKNQGGERLVFDLKNLSNIAVEGFPFDRAGLRGCNFSFSLLSHCSFQRADLSNAFFVCTDLRQCDFTLANLRGAKVVRSDMYQSKLNSADLTKTRRIFAHEGQVATRNELAETDFSYSNCTGADFSNATLVGVKFKECSLKGVNFAGANVSSADFTGANLVGADFTGAKTDGAILKDAAFDRGGSVQIAFNGNSELQVLGEEANRVEKLLQGHKEWLATKGAKGKRADFAGLTLRGIDFAGASLELISFRGATLTGVNLEGCCIASADFSDCHILHSNLRSTDSRGARFTRAEMRFTDLSRSDFTTLVLKHAGQTVEQAADFTGATLNFCKTDGINGPPNLLAPAKVNT